MCQKIDWTNAEEQLEDFKKHPDGAMMNADMNEFRVLACEAAEAVFAKLMQKLEGREDLRDLLQDYSHLKFVIYEFDHIAIGDIDAAKEEIFKALLDEVPEAVSQQVEGVFERANAKAKREPLEGDGSQKATAPSS
jgi:hypothetical protein